MDLPRADSAACLVLVLVRMLFEHRAATTSEGEN